MSENTINKSKLIQLISYLDDKDYKELGLWVRSPIHNSNQMVIDLYDVIKHKYRNTDKPIDTLKIMKHLKMLPRTAGEKDTCPRDKQELRRTMHLLSEQIEDFLIWKATQKEVVVRKRHLMDELMIRRAYPLVNAVMRKARKIQETSPLRDVQHCKNEYLLAQIDLFMAVIVKDRNVVSAMKHSVDTLRRYFLSQLLRYYCFASSKNAKFKTKKSYPMMEVLKSYVTNSKDFEYYTIRFYYICLELVQKSRIEDYNELKSMIYTGETFDNHELRQLFTVLTNFCGRKITEGDNRFMQERFDLYKEVLRKEILTDQVQFSASKFIEIVETGLKVNQPEWINEFIQKYSPELGPNLREDTVNYSKALYAFHFNKYNLAQDFLHAVNKMNLWLMKVLLIKIYYDKNELTFDNIDTHPINSELEALLQLTRPGGNTKASERNRLSRSNFANFFKRILNRRKKIIGKEMVSIDNIKALKTELADIERLAERKWLNDKLNELMKNVES